MASEPLVQTCEVAFEVARRGWEANPPVEPPAAMRSFIYLPQLPRRAMTVAQRVMEEDAGFRSRVATAATEARVGRAGWLWLHRPPGWEADFSALTGGSPTPAPPMPLASAGSAPSDRRTAVPPPPPPPSPGAPRSGVPPVAAPPPVSRPQPTPPPAPEASPGGLGPERNHAPAPVAAAPVESRESLEAELAGLRGLVDRLADERENVGAALTASPTSPALSPAGPLPAPGPDSIPSDVHLVAERDAARAERDSARQDQRQLEDRIVSLEARLRRVTQDLDAATTERDAAESEKAAVSARNEAIAAERDALVAERDALIAERDALVAERDALVAERDAVAAERDAAVAEAVELRAERVRMTATMDEVDRGRSHLEAELADLSGRWQRIQNDLTQLIQRNSMLEAELDRVHRMSGSADADRRALVNELAQQLARVEAERDVLASKLEAADTGLARARSALATATQALRDELDSCGRAVGDSSQAARAIHAAVSEATLTIEQLADASDSGRNSDGAREAEHPDEGSPVAAGFADQQSAAEQSDAERSSAEQSRADGPTVLEPSIFEPDVDGADFESTDFEVADLEGADLEGTDLEVADLRAGSSAGDESTDSSSGKTAGGDLDQVLAAYGLGASELHTVGASPESPPETPTANEAPGQSAAPTEGAPLPPAPPGPAQPTTPRSAGRVQIGPITGDPLSIARHTVTTEEVVLLIDGDPVAAMGWPMLSPIERREALVGNLGDLVGDTGAAVDVVFDGSVADDAGLPSAPAVRVRLTASDLEPSSAISDLVDAYPLQWPVAVVTDDSTLANQVRTRGASVLDNGQLLDLFIAP